MSRYSDFIIAVLIILSRAEETHVCVRLRVKVDRKTVSQESVPTRSGGTGKI
jgi:hypothetical protein